MRAFARCDARQLYRLARWGDVIEAQPGEAIVRENHTDYWFFVILSGSAQVNRSGKAIATLKRGDHFGEVAIVGFSPQAATVTATEPTMLFVLGRRYLLTIAATDRSVQEALFPQVEPGGYGTFVRRLHAEGQVAWQQLRPRYGPGRTPPVRRSRPPGRSLSWSDAIELLSHHDRSAGLADHGYVPAPTIRRRSILAPLLVVLAAAVGVAPLYHPPVAVVGPGRSIDVVADITIAGATVSRPTGRYLLTPVFVERPTMVGLLLARMRGQVLVRTAPGTADEATAQRRAHEQFLDSHREAIILAERTLGLDARGITIVIRDRGIVGPSAGLVYALAIADMLDPHDLAAGRVIAATGELLPTGKVAPIGFVSLKRDVAAKEGASIFLVPAGQDSPVSGSGPRVIAVSSLAEAVRALLRSAR